MSHISLSNELDSLLLQSKQRWLRTNEIYTLLLNISNTNLRSMALNKLPYQPKNGDVFIINGDTQQKKWKNDGYLYLPRKNGVGFREDIEKLKIGGIKEIVCYYSYIVQPNYSGSISEILMNRRIYKLMNPIPSIDEANFYLVHYMKEPSQSSKLSVRSELTEDKNTQETRSIPNFSPFNFSESPIDDQTYPETGALSQKNEEMMVLERDFVGMDPLLDPQQNYDFCQEVLNFENPSDVAFLEKPKQNNMELPQQQLNNNNITSPQDSTHYQMLQNRIMELEARIHDLEFEKQSVSGQNNTNSTVSNSVFSVNQNNNAAMHNNFPMDYKIKINDFSPEWDFVEGGSKMMVCFSPNLMIPTEDQNNKLVVMFGNVEARGFCIQPGVLKCYVPPHSKGFVKLSLVFNKERIDDILDKNSMFEYRKAHAIKRKNPKLDELILEKEDTKKISHDFKVRVIEKLSSFHQNLVLNYQNSNQSSYDKKWKLEEIPAVLSDFRENSEKFDVSVFTSIFSTIMKKAEESNIPREFLTESLNELNSDGFGLIHYLILINFYETIPVLSKYNIDLNLCSKSGVTPLQIAIAFNYEHAVEMLIKHGVINSSNIGGLINNNNSNKNLLDQNIANLDVLFKNSHILDMIMREVTLQDSINNSNSVHTEKFSCNNQDDQEEDNYFNILELLDEMEDKLAINSDEEVKNLRKEKNMENENEKQGHFELKKHKYLKFHSKKNKKESKKKDFQGLIGGNDIKTKEVYVTHQEHIRTIQKNVRGWLLRRQYLDIKYAARVLQNYIRGKLAKKQMSPEYKMLIKNKLKDWLNLKC